MLEYLVRYPKSDTKNPPVLLLLHGYGSNESDLFSFSDEIHEDYLILSLKAPIALDFGGFCWYEINYNTPNKFTNIPQAIESQELILNFIEKINTEFSEYTFEEISLCGFSQGAILSLSLALHYPEKFKKILCLSGYPEAHLLQTINAKADFSELEFFVSHGTEDTVIPIDWARNFKRLADTLHLKYTYKEYNAGHGINTENYYDLLAALAF